RLIKWVKRHALDLQGPATERLGQAEREGQQGKISVSASRPPAASRGTKRNCFSTKSPVVFHNEAARPSATSSRRSCRHRSHTAQSVVSPSWKNSINMRGSWLRRGSFMAPHNDS